jgi:hypothetical protein
LSLPLAGHFEAGIVGEFKPNATRFPYHEMDLRSFPGERRSEFHDNVRPTRDAFMQRIRRLSYQTVWKWFQGQVRSVEPPASPTNCLRRASDKRAVASAEIRRTSFPAQGMSRTGSTFSPTVASAVS